MKRQTTRNGYTRLSKDSDEEEELYKKTPYKEIQTVEKIVEEGDTLQSISIKYHCPIAELKRLNNIHKENEIFARNAIRVPARVVSMPGVHDSGNNSPKNGTNPHKEIDKKIIDKLTTLKPDELNVLIFNSLSKPIEEVEPRVDIDEEHINLLPIKPIENKEISRSWTFSGADADINWIPLILCVVIIILLVPLVYILYIKEHPEEYHHKHW